jgi:hypothetical protein
VSPGRQAKAGSYWPASARPTPEPAPRELGGEPFFGVYPLRLFDGQIGSHLINPGRHPVGQGAFHGKIGRMARFARGKFSRLLFGPMLGGRNLCLKRCDMGFERSDHLIGQCSFVRITGTLSATVNRNDILPALRRTNSRPFIVSKRLLPLATLCPLPDRLGRYPQKFGGLPVGKPLARQIVPRQ